MINEIGMLPLIGQAFFFYSNFENVPLDEKKKGCYDMRVTPDGDIWYAHINYHIQGGTHEKY